MKVLLVVGLTVLLLALAFSGIAIKMFFKKGATFEKKSCCSATSNKTGSCACSS